ncbi:hypothetical protein VTO73DRAFT_9087 [Trametes versicolor]
MSQYSLSTCDPLQKGKADRKDVRRAPHVTGSVSTVLFETGTIDTFPRPLSRRDTGLSTQGRNVFKTLPPALWRTTSGSISEEADEQIITPTKNTFGAEVVFGGPVFDSPCHSRASTMDESAALLVQSQIEQASSSGISRTDAPKRGRKRPSPLGALSSAKDPAPETLDQLTPVATPASPSAKFARAFGAFFKTRR